MKKLKRALSLVLSAAMLLGMMVVGTGASYSDVPADNEYVEAIEVMQAIGVMSGVSEGKFNPDGLVTRHEAAVIMANLLELDVADFETAISPFNDVADWAVPYVAACYSDGIMAGVGNGNFGGEIKVTAAQMALMLMKALGYFQFEADFGDDWQLATVREASKIELFEDVNTSATANLTRGQVAQMCLNALEADTVDWEGDLGTSVSLPDGTTVVSGYSIKYVSDKYMGSEDVYNGDKDGIIQLAEKLFDEDLIKSEEEDDFGRPATKWEWENDEIGTYGDKADKIYTTRVTKDTLYKDLGKTLYEDLFDAKETETLTVIEDGEAEVIDRSEDEIKRFINKNDTDKINGRASTVEVYIDDDTNDVTIVIINTYVVQAIDDYSEKKESLKIDRLHAAKVINSNETELDVDDFPVIKDVSEDDYLLVTVADGEIQSVKMAETLTGRVNTYTTSDTVTIDGTKYNYAGTIDSKDNENGKAVSYSVGEDATVVLADGFIIYVDEAAVSAEKYVYIAEIKNDAEFDDDDAEFIAKAYFLDGTKKTIDIKDEFKSPKQDVKGGESGWFTYSVNDNNVYTLYQIDEDEKDEIKGRDGVMTENKKTKLGDSSISINSDTMIIYIDEDGDPQVATGVKNIPTIEGVTNEVAYVVLDEANGKYADYIFIDAEDCDIDESSSSEDFIFVLDLSASGYDANDEEYYSYNAIVNGETGKIQTDYELDEYYYPGTDSVMMLFADVQVNSDGYITDMSEIEEGDEDYETVDLAITDAIVDYEKDVLTIGDYSFVLDDDCQIVLIVCDKNIKTNDGEDCEVYTNISAKSLANECDDYVITDGGFYAQQNDDDELTALYLIIYETEEA